MEYPFKSLMPLDETAARDGYYKDWTHIDANTFHQISELAQFIREKGYGADTREAIAQALERVYHDAMNSGNSNMEVSMARKHFKNLAARLDASDADMRNISVDWINKNLGKLDQTFMSEEFLQQMAGNTPINAVPADGVVTRPKIAKNAVSVGKTDFIETSTNLFDFNSSVNEQVIGQTGAITSNTLYGYYGPIEVSPNERLISTGVGSIAFYTSEDQFISRLGNNSSFGVLNWTVPAGAYIARVNYRREGEYYLNRTIQVNRGDLLLPFDKYWKRLNDIGIMPDGIADNSLEREKYKNNSISAEKTDFINVSTNLFDKSDVIMDKVISATGQVVDNISYLISHKIYSPANEIWFAEGVESVATYDEQGVFIRRIDASDVSDFSFTTPKNSSYFIANIHEYQQWWENGIVKINQGTSKPYEDFYKQLATNIKTKNDDLVIESTNLLDLNDVEMGKLISSTGEVTSNSSYWLSNNMIEVEPGDKIETTGTIYLAYLQRNGDFIQRVSTGDGNPTTLTIPSNVNAIRAMGTYYNQHIINRTAKINKNGTAPYEPYFKKLVATGIELSDNLYDFKNRDIYLKPIPSSEFYTAQAVPAKSNMDDFSVAEQYAFFDGFVADNPDYVTRKNYGRDTSGNYDVFAYTFSAKKIPVVDNGKRPTLLIISGTHGYEKTHPYILAHAMKQLIENWKTSDVLEVLRWDVDIVVMPCSNPSSWPNGSRGNSNGVDISRNFEHRWINADPPTGFTKGSAPLSEKESQYIDKMIRDHQENAVFFTSLHDFESVDTNPEQFIWLAAADKFAGHVGQELISKLSRNWKSRYSWLPQDDTYFGFVDNNQPLGAEGHQANLYGVQGGTFEVSDIFKLEPSATYDSEMVLTLGVETLINYMYLNVKHGVDYYNTHPKTGNKYSGKGL